MNRVLFKFVSIAICLAMVMAFTVSAFAKTEDLRDFYSPDDFVARDYAMYSAFMQQTDAEFGITNSSAVNVAMQQIREDNPSFTGGYLVNVTGNCISPLFIVTTNGAGLHYVIQNNFRVTAWFGLMDGEVAITVEEDVFPDLCGDFDVSETLTQIINSPQYDQTHIRSVNVDDCWDLTQLAFNGQRYCRELSALNCPVLRRIEARDCDYRQITVKPMGYDTPLDVSSIGNCSIGMDYSFTGSQDADLYAYPTEELGFIGWFVGGQLVSTETDYVHQGGGKVYACFAGDVNGDGLINIMDANLIMRGSLNLAPMEGEVLFDLDSNGIINTADALLAIRVGMGL